MCFAGQFDPGRSEVVGLAGNPDQAYGAELAERGYPAPRAFDSLEPRFRDTWAAASSVLECGNWYAGFAHGRPDFEALSS
jgi:hypothetical protein